MNLLHFQRKLFASAIIFIALIGGGMQFTVSEWEEHPALYFFLYLILGLFPFMLGFWLFTSTQKFKEKFWFSLRVYTSLTILLVLIFELLNYVQKRKKEMLSHPSDLYLDTIALPDWLWNALLLSQLAAIAAIMAISITWFKVPKYVYLILAISLLFTISIHWLTNEDFRAVREEGIVQSIKGEYKEIPWNEVDAVDLHGYIVDEGKYPDKFIWDFIFYRKQGSIIDGTYELEEILFTNFGCNNHDLKGSIQIKEKVEAEQIPFSTHPLSDEEWKLIKRKIEEQSETEDKLEAEDFERLFEKHSNRGNEQFMERPSQSIHNLLQKMDLSPDFGPSM